jgi:hypothetical protein
VGRAAPCEGLRRRAGRLGDCGGASIMVASEELLLLEEEREREGVEVREAMSTDVGRALADKSPGSLVVCCGAARRYDGTARWA